MYIFSATVLIFTIYTFLKLNKHQNIINQKYNDTYDLLLNDQQKINNAAHNDLLLESIKKHLCLQSILKQNMLKYHEFITNWYLKLNNPGPISQ